MKIEKLKVIRADERGIMYDCDKLKCIERKKGTISADHSHDDKEILYLIKGDIELTVEKNARTVKSPARIEIPPKAYHKLLALSDIILLEDRKGE